MRNNFSCAPQTACQLEIDELGWSQKSIDKITIWDLQFGDKLVKNKLSQISS